MLNSHRLMFTDRSCEFWLALLQTIIMCTAAEAEASITMCIGARNHKPTSRRRNA
jgi:hypothetical protein